MICLFSVPASQCCQVACAWCWFVHHIGLIHCHACSTKQLGWITCMSICLVSHARHGSMRGTCILPFSLALLAWVIFFQICFERLWNEYQADAYPNNKRCKVRPVMIARLVTEMQAQEIIRLYSDKDQQEHCPKNDMGLLRAMIQISRVSRWVSHEAEYQATLSHILSLK